MTWPKTLPKRFWNKVKVGNVDECWEWLGSKSNGCGYIHYEGKERWKASRASWLLHYGEIPEGKHILHICDNRGCVNPNHLYVGNHSANMKDMVNRNRSAKGERHGNSKLTSDKVRMIRALSSRGIPQRNIARGFGIDQSAVSLIVNKKRWEHI